MKKIDTPLGTIAVLAFIAVVASFALTAIPVIKSDPPAHTDDWLGFAGGVIGGIVGGMMTLIAAMIAWHSVQDQIASATKAKEEGQRDAKVAASTILTYCVFAAAVLAKANNACRTAINISEENSGSISARVPMDLNETFQALDHHIPQVETALAYPPVNEGWKDLAASDKAAYLAIVSSLHAIVNAHKNRGPKFDRTHAAEVRHTMLVQLEKDLRKLSPELADRFLKEANF